MSATKIPISDLEAITEITDEHFLAVDDGTTTNKISVENFNASATASAKAYAEAAEDSADAASDSATSASNTADEIDIKLNQASTLVGNAETYAQDASASASAASNSASGASNSATAANNSANAAAGSVTSASNYATLSKSWAQGNTGARADEQYNNAKYWSEVARAAAGGGVTTFNGRSGAVTAQAKDYSAGQVLYKTEPSENPGEDPTDIFVDDALDDLYSKEQTDSGNITNLQGRVTTIEGQVTILTETLAVGATSLTFTSNKFQNNSLVRIFANVDGVYPLTKSISGTTLTLTFDAQEVAVSIKVCIENY